MPPRMAGGPADQGPDELRPYSVQVWVDGALRSRLAAGVPVLAQRLAPWRPRCIFLGGSAALGEAVGWEGSGGERIVLSDLDVGVVTVHRVAEPDRQELARGLPFTPGWYEVAAQARQRPTPGLVEIQRRGCALWGDAEVPRRFAVPAEGSIPAWEAWRLVGNRCLELGQEWVRAEPGAAVTPSPQALFAVAKLAEALYAARLIRQGRWRIGRAVRLAMLEGERGAASRDRVAEAARLWRPFLLCPQAGLVPVAGGVEAVRLALDAWIREAGGDVAPEDRFLGEPLTARERYRRWKAEEPTARGLGRVWRRLALVARSQWGGAATPEGRRMRAAALYWRQSPEAGPDGQRGAMSQRGSVGAGPESRG